MWTLRTAMAVALLVTVIAVASWTGARGQADAEPGFEVPRAPAPQQVERQAVPAPDNGTAERIRTAPQGRVVARGPAMVVDELVTPNDQESLARLTIEGDFPVRALDFTVLVDGKPIGRGIPAADLNAIKVALPQPRTGAVVTYQYGDGPQTTVGKLTVEGK